MFYKGRVHCHVFYLAKSWDILIVILLLILSCDKGFQIQNHTYRWDKRTVDWCLLLLCSWPLSVKWDHETSTYCWNLYFEKILVTCIWYLQILMFSIWWLQFHECPERAIVNIVKEAFRLLRPGGTLALTDQAVNSHAPMVYCFSHMY